MIKAIYGKIKFNRHECPSCGNSLLNNSPWFKCDVCGYSNCDEKATKFKVIVPPPGIRKTPPRHIQKELLKIQDNKCYWCANKYSKVKYLKKHWDHKIPFSYEQTNRDNNWVASCNICNFFKSNFMFKKDRECRDYLVRKWQKSIDNGEISFD